MNLRHFVCDIRTRFLILMFILWGLLLRYFMLGRTQGPATTTTKTRKIVHLGSYHSFFSSSVVGQWWDYTMVRLHKPGNPTPFCWSWHVYDWNILLLFAEHGLPANYRCSDDSRQTSHTKSFHWGRDWCELGK